MAGYALLLILLVCYEMNLILLQHYVQSVCVFVCMPVSHNTHSLPLTATHWHPPVSQSVTDIRQSVTDIRQSVTDIRQSVTHIRQSVTHIRQSVSQSAVKKDCRNIRLCTSQHSMPQRYPYGLGIYFLFTVCLSMWVSAGMSLVWVNLLTVRQS